MIKRILAAALAFAVILVLMPCLTFAAGVAAVKADSTAESCAPGETVAVTFSISGNPGFWGAGFSLEYDSSAFMLTAIEEGRLFSGGSVTTNIANGTIAYYGESLTKNISDDGMMFTAYFMVKNTAKPGKYSICAKVKDGNAKNFIDVNGKSVNVNFSECSISISKGETQSGAGNTSGSEITVTEIAVSSTEFKTNPNTGKATAVVTVKSEDIAIAVVNALDKLKSNGGGAVAEVKITADPGTSIAVAEFDLIVKDIRTIAAAKDVVLTVESSVVTTTLDSKALMAIAEGRQDAESVRIAAEIVDVSADELNAAQKAVTAGNKVVDLTVKVNGMNVSDFKGGKATVTVPYTPPSGYPSADYDLLTAYYLAEDGRYTEMSGAKYDSGKIKFITKHFSKFFFTEWINPFTDLSKADWYYKDVHYSYSYGVMIGESQAKFSGESALTRAQFVQILFNIEGKVKVSANPGTLFTDVPGNEWYSDAISWAGANGIVSGYGNGKFGPNDVLTREQLVTLLYNYANWKDYNTESIATLRQYKDYDSVSTWAYENVQWAVSHGLLSDVPDNRSLAPLSAASRGTAASVMHKFLESKTVLIALDVNR